MQEGCGIRTSGADQTELRERYQNRSLASRGQFGSGIAEVRRFPGVKDCAAAFQKTLPGQVHGAYSKTHCGVRYYIACGSPSVSRQHSMMRWLRRLLGLLIGSAFIFAAWMAWFVSVPLELRASPLDFNVRPGSGLRVAARQIVESGVSMPVWQFTLLARLMGKSADIKAGSYEIERGVTPWTLLEKLTRGDVSQAEIVFPEGWTFGQMRAALDAHPSVAHRTGGLSEREIVEILDSTASHVEGWFFPDTYLFARGSGDIDILRRAHRLMKTALEAEWNSRADGLPYKNSYEALIMASIVEKETGRAADRAQVAAVFVNRLSAGMLLQTDPTVIYGLGARFDGNLRKRDLIADTAYNTYTRPGLPPTPITNPGLASLQAALHPAKSDMLYFVARGDGSSHFSRTLDEHNRAVARYQKRRGN